MCVEACKRMQEQERVNILQYMWVCVGICTWESHLEGAGQRTGMFGGSVQGKLDLVSAGDGGEGGWSGGILLLGTYPEPLASCLNR